MAAGGGDSAGTPSACVLWAVDVEHAAGADLQALLELLPAHEQAEVQRYVQPLDQRRALARCACPPARERLLRCGCGCDTPAPLPWTARSRLMMRALGCRLLGPCHPEDVPIQRTKGGKPFFAGARPDAARALWPNLNFNASHEVRPQAAGACRLPRVNSAGGRVSHLALSVLAPAQGAWVVLASDSHALVGVDVAAPPRGPPPTPSSAATSVLAGLQARFRDVMSAREVRGGQWLSPWCSTGWARIWRRWPASERCTRLPCSVAAAQWDFISSWHPQEPRAFQLLWSLKEVRGSATQSGLVRGARLGTSREQLARPLRWTLRRRLSRPGVMGWPLLRSAAQPLSCIRSTPQQRHPPVPGTATSRLALAACGVRASCWTARRRTPAGQAAAPRARTSPTGPPTHRSSPCGAAPALRRRWRFDAVELPGGHVLSVARGPPSAAVDANQASHLFSSHNERAGLPWVEATPDAWLPALACAGV